MLKRCNKCKKWKDKLCFTKDKKRKDNLNLTCKMCIKLHINLPRTKALRKVITR